MWCVCAYIYICVCVCLWVCACAFICMFDICKSSHGAPKHVSTHASPVYFCVPACLRACVLCAMLY